MLKKVPFCKWQTLRGINLLRTPWTGNSWYLENYCTNLHESPHEGSARPKKHPCRVSRTNSWCSRLWGAIKSPNYAIFNRLVPFLIGVNGVTVTFSSWTFSWALRGYLFCFWTLSFRGEMLFQRYSDCNCKKYQSSTRCLLNASKMDPKVHFLSFQVS